MPLILLKEPEIDPVIESMVVNFFIVLSCALILFRLYIVFEQFYASRFKKPLFNFNPLRPRRLSHEHRDILSKHFKFYNQLNLKYQCRFEHRLMYFLENKQFVGRQGFELTDEVKIRIAATAIMLTFGFRDYQLHIFDKVVIYPSEFYSTTNETYHKGEFNPGLGVIVLSWKHFLEGYDVTNDNINLGIHEFAHAIHFNSLRAKDISAVIFAEGFVQLRAYISENESLQEQLVSSEYFRAYAFTNQFEFLACIIETFIESPMEFREHFPTVYKKTRQMLNFNFAGY